MEDIKPSLSVVYDGSLRTMRAEQPAYFRIMSWVDHQSAELLRKRAMRDFFYDTLINSPDTMRLQIVELKFTAMQIVRETDKGPDGKPMPMLSPEGNQIYQVRGITSEGGTNVCFAEVVDLPPGMEVGATRSTRSAAW